MIFFIKPPLQNPACCCVPVFKKNKLTSFTFKGFAKGDSLGSFSTDQNTNMGILLIKGMIKEKFLGFNSK